MTNPNRPNQTPANDDRFDQSVNTRNVTPDEMAYRDGYVHGKATEQRVDAARRADRDESASKGLIIGLALASLAGLIAGTLYYLNRQPETLAPAPNPVVIPQRTETNRETTIIERVPEASPGNDAGTTLQQPAPTTPDVNINVPQQPAPNVNVDVPEQPAPNVNVDVPEQPAPNVNITTPNTSDSSELDSPQQPGAVQQQPTTTQQQPGTNLETSPDATTDTPQTQGDSGAAPATGN